MNEFDPLIGLGVFGSALAVDVLSALYVRRSAEGKAVQAAVISAASLVLGAVALYAFVKNPFYALPEATGAFIGTYLAVRLDTRKKGSVKK